MTSSKSALPSVEIRWQDFAPSGRDQISDELKNRLWSRCPSKFKRATNPWRRFAEYFYANRGPIHHWPLRAELDRDRDRVIEILVKLLTKVGWDHNHRYPVIGWWLSLILEKPPEIPSNYVPDHH